MSTAHDRIAQLVPLTDETVRAGWAELLSRYQWDAFATLTYANSVRTSEKVLRDFRRWLKRWQVETAVQRGLVTRSTTTRTDAYGRTISTDEKLSGSWHNAYRKGRAFPVWVLGVEQHRSGTLHSHAIIKWSDHLPDLDRRLGWSLWFNSKAEGGFGHGIARIEPPRGQSQVATYVAKYVVKGGEVYPSPSFDARRLTAA